jgi:cyanate permease
VSDDAVPVSCYGVLLVASAGYLAMMLCWFLHAAFLPPITDALDLTNTQAGILAGAVPATYVPLSVASGQVVDRIGPRRTLVVAFGTVGAAQVVRGLAPTYPALLGATVLLAVGGTGVTFGLPKLVSGLFPARLLGSASTVYVLGSQLGAAAAYAAGRTLLGPLLGGWRGAFVWTGAATVVLAGCWLVVATWHARRHPDRHPTRGAGGGRFRRDLRRVFDVPAMRLLVLVGFAYLLLTHGLRGWLPTILEVGGASAAVAASVATAFVAGQMAGAVVVPPASDRLRTRRGAVAACGGVAALGVVAVLAPAGVAVAVAGSVVAGLGVGGVGPLVRAVPTELPDVGAELTGTAVGLIFAVGQVGGFVGPFVVGALRDATASFAPGLTVLAAGGVVMLGAGLRLPSVAGGPD